MPGRPRWLGEREIVPTAYDRETACDWTSGSFMLVRREAIESAGFMDERFFMYSEETDFCRRIKAAGWEIRHLPWMTILHYEVPRGARCTHHRGPERIQPGRVRAQALLVRRRRRLYIGTVLLRHWLRALFAGRGELGTRRRIANWAAIRTLLGRSPVPYGPPSRFAVRLRERPNSPGEVSSSPDAMNGSNRTMSLRQSDQTTR